jgi:hypothetical protein
MKSPLMVKLIVVLPRLMVLGKGNTNEKVPVRETGVWPSLILFCKLSVSTYETSLTASPRYTMSRFSPIPWRRKIPLREIRSPGL